MIYSKSIAYALVKSETTCWKDDELISEEMTLEQCAEYCANEIGCHYFTSGVNEYDGYCYWSKATIEKGLPVCRGGWDEDKDFNFFKLFRK